MHKVGHTLFHMLYCISMYQSTHLWVHSISTCMYVYPPSWHSSTFLCSSSPFLCSSSPVPPDSPSNLVVTYTDNSSISLSWSVGFDGYSNLSSVVISYEVDRYPQDGTRSQTFSMGTSATLTGLYPYSNYTIHVRLTNAVGLVSNPTNITSTTMSLSEPLLLMLY